MNNRTRFRIFIRDDFTCRYCGVKAPDTQLHVDHKYPRSRGGKDTDDNLVTACITCNSGKSNLVLPTNYKYAGGPKDGFVRRTDALPIEWVYEGIDGKLYTLNDAWVDDEHFNRRCVLGPHPWERVYPPADAFDNAMRALRAANPQGRLVRLLGAYSCSGLAPGYEPELEWMDCEQIVLQFDLNVPYVPGVKRAILDTDG